MSASKNIFRIGFLFIIFFIIVTGVMASWYRVDQGELGVVLRNGAVHSVSEAGLHFKLPFFDDVMTISVRDEIRTYNKVASYSKDIQPADLKISVVFRADSSKVAQLYSQFRSIDGVVDRLITPAMQNQVRNVFGRFSAASAIQERERLVAEIDNAVRSAIGTEVIILQNVRVENIDFSNAFEDSVEQRMLAEVEVQKRRQELDREKVQADIVRTQAQAEADRVRAQAQADADAIRLKGDAEAAIIHARGEALRKNPEMIQLIQAERWNGELPKTMVPNSIVPFLNIQK